MFVRFPILRSLRYIPLLALATMAGCSRMPRLSAEDCMARAMYFESNRSSQEGMLAVGTVVMNRLHSGKYPKNVCGVVGQKKQFAPGVLSKDMGKGRDLAYKTARLVLRGKTHPEVGRAMFFHTAGYSYPYTNMQYVTIAGGNAFYEKRRNATSTQEDVRQRLEARLRFVPPQRSAEPLDSARFGGDLREARPARPPGREDLQHFSNEWTIVATDTPLEPPSSTLKQSDYTAGRGDEGTQAQDLGGSDSMTSDEGSPYIAGE